MKQLITICLIMLTAAVASAQKNLDDIMNTLIEGKKGVEVIVSEQRDPATHQLTLINYMITSKDKALFKEITSAIHADRPTATSFSKVGDLIYSLTFTDGESVKSYSLILDDDTDEWMFNCNLKPVRKPRGETKGAKTKPDAEI